jgi:glycosyltransferase involved in cell wall biosynthesis
MRILFLAVDIDLREQRGDSVHVRELVSNLVAIGNEVILITGTPGIDRIGGAAHLTRRGTTLGQAVQGIRAARGWADVIYERRFSPKLSLLISTFTGVPFLMEVNGVLDEERPTSSNRNRRQRRFRFRLRRAMISRARGVVAVSQGIRDSLLRTYHLKPERVVVIPNGANTALFAPKGMKESRQELGLSPDGHVACFVGNMVGWQGVTVLLDAFSSVIRDLPGSTLVLVGEGPELPSLKGRARDLDVAESVRFAGRIPYDRVPTYICAANVCVAPFLPVRKASPIKVFEYLACGIPVIVSDVDEVGEFVRSAGCGLVVKPGDPNALAESLRWFFAHPAEARRSGQLGRDVVVRERSWNDTARRLAQELAEATTP